MRMPVLFRGGPMTLNEMREKIKADENEADKRSHKRIGYTSYVHPSGHRSQYCLGITHNLCTDPLCECACHDCDMWGQSFV